MLAVHLTDELVERFTRLLVEIAGGLVGEQHRRARGQGAGDGDPLLLAAGEHCRPVVAPLAQTDLREQRLGPRPPLGGRQPSDPERHLGVLERRELRQEVVELEDEADVAVPEGDELAIGHPRDLPPLDPDRPLVDAIQPAQHVQEGALPHAGGADDRHHLAARDRELHAAQHDEPPAGDRIALDDPRRLDAGLPHRLTRTAAPAPDRARRRAGRGRSWRGSRRGRPTRRPPARRAARR